jgi:pSer/pThr/pTyr-binding forkhead associated (FHA) protein
MKVTLRIVQGRPEGKSLLFPRGEYVFGRGTECHVRPNSDWVSRQHCLLRVTGDGAFLRDLGSRNGTLINGERLFEERELDHGDQVQVGPLVFEVVLEESVSDTIPNAAATTPDETLAPTLPGVQGGPCLPDTAERRSLPGPAVPPPDGGETTSSLRAATRR